jgi:hypothetical protein
MIFIKKHIFFIAKIIIAIISIFSIIGLIDIFLFIQSEINYLNEYFNYSEVAELFNEYITHSIYLVVSIILMLAINVLLWIIRPLSADRLNELKADITARKKSRAAAKIEKLRAVVGEDETNAEAETEAKNE